MPQIIRMTRSFEAEDLERFTAACPPGTEYTAERDVRVAAEKKLVKMARDLAFTTDRPMLDAIQHVAAQNPELLRLSRSPIASSRREADVVLL